MPNLFENKKGKSFRQILLERDEWTNNSGIIRGLKCIYPRNDFLKSMNFIAFQLENSFSHLEI